MNIQELNNAKAYKTRIYKTHDLIKWDQIADLLSDVREMSSYFEFIANGANTGEGKKNQTMFELNLALAQDTARDNLSELAEALTEYVKQVDRVQDQRDELNRQLELWNVDEDWSDYWEAENERQYLNSGDIGGAYG